MNNVTNILVKIKKNLLLFGGIFSTVFSFSQHQNLPINFGLSQQLEYNKTTHTKEKQRLFHSATKPYITTFTPLAYSQKIYNDTGKYYYAFTEKLFQKNLLSVAEDDLKLVADPLFNFSYGKTTANDSLYKISNNTRGIRVAGDITKKFSFETQVYENQVFYTHYIDSIANIKGTALGIGRSKKFKETGHDVAMSTGYASYSPNQDINIQFGQGKHFIGNGYRSLLLSDNASPAPYLGITLQFLKDKFQYRSINSWMQSLTRLPATNSAEALFKRKGASFKYLSFIPSSNLQVGLFEGVIYQNYIDSIGHVALPSLFYIPVIGLNSSINGLSNPHNSIVGININYQIKNSFSIYGQLMMDDVKKNGIQIGAKWFNCFNSLNSWVQVEYNSASANAYSTINAQILQSYTHTNQELAHPLGANFNEFLVMGHFEKDRLLATGKFVYYYQKSFSSQGLSSSPLIATDLNSNQAILYNKNVSFSAIEVSYLLNRKTNMQLFGSYNYRNEHYSSSDFQINTNNFESFWMLGFRTTLLNFYHDI